MVVESEYKGFPVLKIEIGRKKDGEPDYLIVGLRKARAIVENMDEISSWVDRNSEDPF